MPAEGRDVLRSKLLVSGHFPDVPGYSIREKIGEGGMGSVYRAVQVKLNRTVALKLLHGGTAANTKDRSRFVAEAEAVAAIDHPNVVKVFDTGDAEGQAYLAMEYLSGGGLGEKLKISGLLDPKDAAQLIRKLALAVQAAHDCQIVHRDLKPANVLFDAIGEPRVCDFGLAKTAGGDLTNTNAIMGTAAYMAPEQARGESKFVGPAADVWALGVIFFECLTGTKPFTGIGDFDVILKVIEDEPSSLRSISSSLPRDLELIVQKCLSKEPSARYASASAMAEDLQRWLKGEPVSVKAAGPTERAMKWMKRNKIATTVLAASLAGVAITSGLAAWALQERSRADGKTLDAIHAEAAAKTSADEAAAKEKLARDEVFRSRAVLDVMRIREAETSFQQNIVQHARDTLDLVADSKNEGLNRTIAWQFARRLADGSDWMLPTPALVSGVAWSPDGRKVVTAGSDGCLRLWDAEAGKQIRAFYGHTGWIADLAWKPDGQMIASCSSDQSIRLWDIDSGLCVKALTGHRLAVASIAWSADGQQLASSSDDGTARLWNPETGECVKVLSGHRGAVMSVMWSPDGTSLATGGEDNTARIWNAGTGECVHTLNGHTNWVADVAWSPDGHVLATASTDKSLRLWNPVKGQCVRELTGHQNAVKSVAWSPDSQALASCGLDNTLRIWDPGTGSSVPLKGHVDWVANVAWSPDGRSLASAGWDTTVRIWNVRTIQSEHRLHGHTKEVTFVAWSPDGKSVASSSADGTVRLSNAATGQLLKSLHGHQGTVLCAAWHPDGRTIATSGIDHSIRLWNTDTGQEIASLSGHTNWVASINWNRDGSLLVSASFDKTLRVWDIAGRTTVQVLSGHTNSVACAAWSPDGKTIASASFDKSVRLWDVASGQCRTRLEGHAANVMGVAWSPDGKLLASASMDWTIRLWDPNEGILRKELSGHSNFATSVAWNFDGRTLASGSADATVRLWDVQTGLCQKELRGTNSVMTLAWSPDGQCLATGDDHAVWLRDAPAGPTIKIFNGHTAPIIRVEMSADGKQVVSTAMVGQGEAKVAETIVWDAVTGTRLVNATIPETVPQSDARISFVANDKQLLKVDHYVPGEEVSRRERILARHPEHHRNQAKSLEASQQWYAAAFHLKRLLLSEPGNSDARARLQALEQKLKPKE